MFSWRDRKRRRARSARRNISGLSLHSKLSFLFRVLACCSCEHGARFVAGTVGICPVEPKDTHLILADSVGRRARHVATHPNLMLMRQPVRCGAVANGRSEENTSELQSL